MAEKKQLAVGQFVESSIVSHGQLYRRILVKTHFIEAGEDISDIINSYLQRQLRPGDWVVVSEKCIATSLGFAIAVEDIRPGWWARFLSRFVRPSRYGRGSVGSPEKMHKAIEMVGLGCILLAALLGGLGRLLGISGLFYLVAGKEVSSIDGQSGPPDWAMSSRVVLPVPEPERVAGSIAVRCGYPVIIADINDVGGSIKGVSHPELKAVDFVDILRDNPMGQQENLTPLAIVRAVR